MKIDIPEQDLKLVSAILTANLPATSKVFAYGSRVKGKAKQYSDLDLAIDAGKELSLAQITALSTAFEDSSLAYKVDITDLQTLSKQFYELIKHDLIELKC